VTSDRSHDWWQEGIIYQVYPRSFKDSNGDGIGDLRGLMSKLDYLEWLGVNAVWISPIYPSPMADFGYDVSDHTGIDPIFGTLQDFDELLAAAHKKGIRILMDFVPNHTSDRHPWFIESRSSKNNPKRDWFIWRPPAPNGGPPNNWLSNFGGSAWEYDAATGEYYYHAFLKEQPDLNWRNPEAQDAMLNVLRFWLDRGVDGFRVDVIWHIIKDEQFRDNPKNPSYQAHQPPHQFLLATYSTDRPEVHDIISRMRDLVNSYKDRLLIGEIYLPMEKLMTYYGTAGLGLHLPFNFQLLELPWNAAAITTAINDYEAALPSHGWPNWVLGNHDNPRIATRAGRDQARVAAMLLLTLRGTPTLYYGDEIGMENIDVPPDLVQDPLEKNIPGQGLGRDPERAPMPWDAMPQAGFTSGRPWLPLPSNAAQSNVAAQARDEASLLALYRRLIALRRKEPALRIGWHRSFPYQGPVMRYARWLGPDWFLVLLNLSNQPQSVRLPEGQVRSRVLLSTRMDREGDVDDVLFLLAADEGVVIRLNGVETGG
jgi:alpha-glucosidase